MTTPLLRLDAPPYEVAALREVIRTMLFEAPQRFDALFAPLGKRDWVVLPPEQAFVLKSFGLIVTRGNEARGVLPIRRRGSRVYVMSLGGVGEYRQDVWPETDALIAKLDSVPPGRVLDMGTGCGIVGIEAVALGHHVVATDLYANTLALAQFNAALADTDGMPGSIEFRQGHLFDPVVGEQFDLVLTAPHYTLVADQLRLEALRTAAPLSTPTGRVVIATFCEWTDAEDRELAVARTVLADHARAGYDVQVTPMVQHVKQWWFTVPELPEPIAGLPSRHRFMVEITRAAGATGSVHVTMPDAATLPRTRYRKLARLGLAEGAAPRVPVRSQMLSVITDADDLAQLERLVGELRGGLVTLDGELPSNLLDACRWGARPCAPLPPDELLRGAVGAQLDRDGGVRPCAHGEVLATSATGFTELLDIYRVRSAATQEQRGCSTCAAREVCSKCMFPRVLDDDRYCATIRGWADALPALKRLTEILFVQQHVPAPLRIKLRRTVPLLAARGRGYAGPSVTPEFEHAVGQLAAAWKRTQTAIAVDGSGQFSLFWWDVHGRIQPRAVHPTIAAIGELAADGSTASELLDYLRTEGVPVSEIPRAFGVLQTIYTLT